MNKKFPVGLLRPLSGRATGVAGDVSIDVPFEPFHIDGEEIDTSIHLEGVNLPTLLPRLLAGKRFIFPANPQPGYVDASIYIQHAHHPLEVREISFSLEGHGGLIVQIAGRLLLEIEGLQFGEEQIDEYEDTDVSFSASITFDKTV